MKDFCLLFVIFLLLQTSNLISQEITANVLVSNKNKTISENIKISGVEAKNDSIFFLLNEILTINYVKFNNKNIKFYIDTTQNEENQKIYYLISEKPIKLSDTLSFNINGKFINFNDSIKNNFETNGNIVSDYGIFRANCSAAWHPLIIKNHNITDVYTKKYNYNLSIKSDKDCYIQIADKKPVKQQTTINNYTGKIMLLIGKYKWNKIDNNIFINIDKNKQTEIQQYTSNIKNYYDSLMGIPINNNFVFIRLKTHDINNWAFFNYPQIVYIDNQRNKWKDDMGLISHEIAHYYFGNIYIPKSNLHWFYSESFTEYLSFKYQIHSKQMQTLKKKYHTLKLVKLFNLFYIYKVNGYSIEFINLKYVNDKYKLTEVQVYNFSPFQLLGIEHEIGEEKMVKFIKTVFSNISNDKDGYITMLKSLKQVGVDEKTIHKIEKKYFFKLKLRKYKFVKKYF